MARLPIPGSDEDVWGDILNEYLSVEHNADGTLKASGTIASKADDSAVVHDTGNETIDGTKTFSDPVIVATPTAGSHATTKNYVDSAISAGAPDATTISKGIVQLAGDLSGTATSPTVPGLAGKEPTITAGTTSEYWRGDKTFQTLDKTAVGLSNVDNTSDANKPVSTAQQTAIDAKVADAINDGTTTVAPSQNAVFDALALKQDSLGFTPENVANKSTNTSLGNSNTLYPSQNAVKTYVDTVNATNANLTGPITSVGNATSVASQTGTGSTFVMNTSPTLITPNIGVATGTSLGLGGAVSTQTLLVSRTGTNTSGADIGAQVIETANPASAPAAGTSYRGVFVQTLTSSGNAQDLTNATLFAGLGQTTHQGTATLGNATGMSFSVNNTNTGTITTATNFSTLVNNTSTGTITTANGLSVSSTLNSGGGTITTNHGINISAQTAGVTNYAIRGRAGLYVFNEDGVSDADFRVEGDTDQNLLFTDASADAVGIGTATPGTKLTVDGVISAKAGTSTGQIAKVGGKISSNTTAVGNVGVGEDDLMTYSVPANTLATNHDSLFFRATLTIANNVNTKRIRVKFGATTILDTGAAGIPISAALNVVIQGEVIRTGATSQLCNANLSTDNTVFAASAGFATAAETLSGAVTLKITGEAVSNDDISQKSMVVDWKPAP